MTDAKRLCILTATALEKEATFWKEQSEKPGVAMPAQMQRIHLALTFNGLARVARDVADAI